MGEIVRALLALQEEEGWLPPARLEGLAERLRVPLHRLESVSTFYTHFRREEPCGVEVSVCRDLSCRLAGAESACARLREDARRLGGFEVRETSCLGRCDRAPAAAIGDRLLDASDPESILRAVADPSREGVARPRRAWPAADPYRSPDGSSDGSPDASTDVTPDASTDVSPNAATNAAPEGDGRESSSADRYRVLRSVLSGPREAPIASLEAAGLRGMGGAGFPTARKWSMVAAAQASPKHVICNADESEPGTFKDREILHDLPHLVIEGMAIAAFCIGAERGTVFIRHEYGPERLRLEAEIAAARALGALGKGIFGSDFHFDVDVFVSPGGYILGEETALLECMEDRRGEPRNKPPFPGSVGLRGMPTLINNVETLVHAVSIVHHGADWWHGLGLGGYSGHKFVSVSGDVAEPGVSLFAVGTPLADVLAQHDGMAEGRAVGAIAPGGASSNFLGAEALDLALDFDALSAAGTMLGSGAVVFIGEDRDLLDVGLSITRFFRNESCGKCVPCRVGCEKAVSLVEGGDGKVDLSLLRALAETMQQTSICGLGQVALGPLLSIASRFPDRVPRVDSD